MSEKLGELYSFYQEIRNCSKCSLQKSRKQVVVGEGGYKRPILLLGEAPGRTEDALGRPFTGKAGKLLDDILRRNGLSREDLFITNSVKCRPPNNRKPYKNEVIACSAYLKKELEVLKPKVIITLGATGLQALSLIGVLKNNDDILNYNNVKLKEVRDKTLTLRIDNLVIKVVPTYHPAACLRNPSLVRNLQEDIKRAVIELETPFID
jgi:uracil-DNA glycosylase family 4